MTRSKAAFLAEADELIHKPQFSREDASRVESILAMADRLPDDLGARQNDLTSVLPVDRSFRAYLSRGQNAVKEGVIDSKRLVGNTSEIRNAQSTTTSAGGYLVPQSFADRFESMLVAYDRLFDVATLFQTTTGSATGYPILEDTANAAAVVAENITSAAGPDLVFATLAFDKTPTWRSGMIRAAVELVNDSAFNFEQLLAGAGAARMARGIGATFVSTLLSSATLGKTAAATTAITGDELFDLVDSVDPAYQANGSWLMARPTFTSLLKLKASTGGTYLFESAIDSAGRPTLLGFPVYLCPSMPAATAGLKAISFGDHSKFIRREVKGSLAVKTYVERYAELGQVGYEVFYRCDGGLLKSASNSPVKYLQMHA